MQTVHQIDRLGRILNTFHFSPSELKAAVKLATDVGIDEPDVTLNFGTDPLYLKVVDHDAQALAFAKTLPVAVSPHIMTRVGQMLDQFVVVHWLGEYDGVESVDVMCRSDLYFGLVSVSADDGKVWWQESRNDEPCACKLYDMAGAQLTFARAGLVVTGGLVCL